MNLWCFIRDSLYHIIPCQDCQSNFKQHIKSIPSRKYPKTRSELFSTLYALKKKVNSLNRSESITLDELRERLNLYAFVDDILVSDTILLLAMSAQWNHQVPVLLEFCSILSDTLPMPKGSPLVAGLIQMAEPVVFSALRMNNDTRKARGVTVIDWSYLKTVVIQDTQDSKHNRGLRA